MKSLTDKVKLIGVDLKLDYKTRMELIKLLASEGEGETTLRIHTYNGEERRANINVIGGFGVDCDVKDMAVIGK